jgi:hypothetical protein
MNAGSSKCRILVRTALTVVVILFGGCSHRDPQDATAMDAILGNGSIDNIEWGSLYRTNRLPAEKVRAFVAAFNYTNRVTTRHDARGSIEEWISFKNGSNYLMIICIFENGVLNTGDYYFNLKQPPP